MNPGHEDCPADEIHETTLTALYPRITRICLHEHQEPVTADDGLGTGPIVADHCQCCDTIIRRDDYR